MHVTFKSKEGHKDRWEILVNGEKWREVHRAIFGKKPTFPSLSSEERLQTAFDALEYRRVKGYVLWRLSNQSYHSEQLAKLLRERLVQQSTIDRILKEYHEMGFLDDEAWLQNFIRSHQKRYGLRLILAKLYAKGICSDRMQKLAKEWANSGEGALVIQQLLQTKYRSKDLSDYKTRQKVIAALMRKGYAFDHIQSALQQFAIEAED